MKRLFIYLFYLLSFVPAIADHFRFSSLQFGENGDPSIVTCVFRISSAKRILPQGVILTNTAQGGFITTIGPAPKLLRRTMDFYEIEASFDLSKLPATLPGSLDESMGWKFESIEDTIKNVKMTGFIKIAEFKGALVGFDFGDANSDPKVLEWFLKSSSRLEQHKPTLPPRKSPPAEQDTPDQRPGPSHSDEKR